jgi:hypothetical protein
LSNRRIHLRGNGCNRCYIKHSKPSIGWLNFIKLKDNIEIQHAENIGSIEYQTQDFTADIVKRRIQFMNSTETIGTEIQKFIHRKINKTTNCTFGELYQNIR